MDTKVLGYTVIFEQAEDGSWGGYAPDLPTILVNGDTLEEAKENMRTGIELWIEEMKAQGLPIPAPTPQDTVRELQVEYSQVMSEHEMWTGKYRKCHKDEDKREQQKCLERLKELGTRAINIQEQIRVLMRESPTEPQ